MIMIYIQHSHLLSVVMTITLEQTRQPPGGITTPAYYTTGPPQPPCRFLPSIQTRQLRPCLTSKPSSKHVFAANAPLCFLSRTQSPHAWLLSRAILSWTDIDVKTEKARLGSYSTGSGADIYRENVDVS
jgi:hypothetical protein